MSTGTKGQIDGKPKAGPAERPRRPNPEVVVTVRFEPVPWTAEREAARRAAMEAIIPKSDDAR
jgi:hypothetical protein